MKERPRWGTNPMRAMVLAAGLGTRMRPLTDKTPKALLSVGGRTLLDRALDRLDETGVEVAVVNLHHLGDRIERHLKGRQRPRIVFSDEREGLLETGGGVRKALPLLGTEPFFAVNADALWLNGAEDALGRLARRWDDAAMDALLLLHSTVDAYGYAGMGDFRLEPDGKVRRRPEQEVSPYLFAGIQILHPRLFHGSPGGAFSLNLLFGRAIDEERLYGIVHDGEWFHVGTPEGLADAEEFMNDRHPGRMRR